MVKYLTGMIVEAKEEQNWRQRPPYPAMNPTASLHHTVMMQQEQLRMMQMQQQMLMMQINGMQLTNMRRDFQPQE
jgi:hypothetical protein